MRRLRCARSNKGDFLVEALISSIVASIIIGATFDMFVKVRQASNITEDQLVAAAIAQASIDSLRALPFTMLSANVGTHYPPVIGDSNSATGDPLFPRPLFEDDALDYDGNGNGKIGLGHKKHKGISTVDPVTRQPTNYITVNLSQNGGSTSAVQVQVIICWLDTTGSPRQLQMTSLITPDGLNG